VSGPVRSRPLPAGPAVRGRTSAFERIARIPDNRIVDRILRSRGVIWLIGIMLGGIVAMQVSLLRLNTGISRAVQTTETVAHQNQTLKLKIAELSSSSTIREKAADMNMVDPPAGDRRFLTSRGAEKDAKRAAKRAVEPSMAAQLVEANGGRVPGPGATLESLRASQQGTATAQVQATPTPVAPTEPQQPLPTPVPTVAPPATAVPTVDPATGLAPQG
jgi:hypothetical protein